MIGSGQEDRGCVHHIGAIIMVMSRRTVTLLALVLSSATLPAAGLAADVCQSPTFRIAQGSPFQLRPTAGVDSQPTALAAGTYVARPGAQPGCGCDLAVGLKSKSVPSQGFLARLRGNDDGTFTGSPDALHQLDGIPVAVATGRFRTDVSVDGIVVVTSTSAGNGKVQVFVPDATGTYPQSPTAVFPAGPNPAAITTGDFNGDGQLDVAVINQGNSSLTILLGTGTGAFAPNVFTVADLGGSPESLTAGKFSGSSGADDIAIGVVQIVGGSRQVGIIIVPGSSTGQFAPKPIILVGQRNSFGPSIAAANLSGPSDSALGRRWRDLAIAFTDSTPSGDAVGRVKVLLGRDGGGFGDVNAAQTLDLGAALPRSIKVADLDDDGVVDLIVSTFGDLRSQTDGTIRFFQGHAAPDPNVGFQPNQRWFTIPETTGIRPRALVAARFGNHSPGQPLANVGLAAINAPDLDSIAVFQGNGRGAFTQPSLVTTPITDDDQLFVPGDFHSADGTSPLQDLAFITKASGENVLRVRQANGAGGFAAPDPGQPPLLVGNSPSHMVAGQFVPNGPLGLAIIDDTGGTQQQPVLKIFLGQGNRVLTPGGEVTIVGAGRPRAIVTGHFRGPDMPLDIAVVGDTTPAGSTTASGTLTLLFNKGHGVFTVGTIQALGFAPGSLAASNRLRAGGKTDVLIRDANANRFLFLINIEPDPNAFRPAIGPNQGFFTDAGNVDALLVGNVAHDGSDALDDVVTFDGDMTLKIFINNGQESFDLQPLIRPDHPNFRGAQPPYVSADFGSGKLGLAAIVVRGDDGIGLTLLQANDAGGFTVAAGAVELELPGGAVLSSQEETVFSQSSLALGLVVQQTVGEVLAGQFRSTLHGNNKVDLAFTARVPKTTLTEKNACPSDPRPTPPTPPQEPPFFPTTCGAELDDFQDCPHPPCFSGPCCHCRTGPPHAQCPNTCNVPAVVPPPPLPFMPFCITTKVFPSAVTVFGNTCGD
jgi:FG-GAP-like repeat